MGPGSKQYCNLVDFKEKFIRNDKEVQFILIKKPVNQEDLTILNIQATNSGVPNFTKMYYWN